MRIPSCLSVLFAIIAYCGLPAPAQTANQTRVFTEARSRQVADVSYHLYFGLEKGSETYEGAVEIKCRVLDAGQDLVLDFKGESVNRLAIDDQVTSDFRFLPEESRILLPAASLKPGDMRLAIGFTGRFEHDGSGFHRFVDPADGLEYHFSDFQPENAHEMFPCFDQPDLKGTFELEVLAPPDWEIISNSRIARQFREGERRKTIFHPSARFSTYLFHLSAGPFAAWHDPDFRVPLGIYCRQSLAKNMDPDHIFATTRRGFDFFEDYFDYPFPFQKYDHIFVPEFNAGAMENVAAVTVNERSIYPADVPKERLTYRDITILHELAHMWFGDLVTMKWWNDLWLNESFATYMSFLALERTEVENPWTYANPRIVNAADLDRKVTTHPILAEVPDIRTASSIFDGITYGKGQAALRQLDLYLGGTIFRDGVRHYLRQHAWGNTTLADFTQSLEQIADRPLETWVRQWLMTADINEVRLAYRERNGTITDARILQMPGRSNDVLRAHVSDIGLFYSDERGKAVLRETIPVTYSGAEQAVPLLDGKPVPAFLLPNLSNLDYAVVALDDQSLAWILQHVGSIEDFETRSQVWNILWDMVKNQRLGTRVMLDLILAELETETNARLLGRLQGYAMRIIRAYIPDEAARDAYRQKLYLLASLRVGDTTLASDVQREWFDTLIGCTYTPAQQEELVGAINGKPLYANLTRDIRRKWNLLIKLARLGYPGSDAIAEQLHQQDASSRARNYLLLLAATKATPEAKEAAWRNLTEAKGFSQEEMRFIAGGFHDREQAPLLRPYAAKYFAYLTVAIDQRPFEFVQAFAAELFPDYCGEETVRMAEAFLQHKKLDGALHTIILEQVDDLKRELAIRANWDK